MFESVRKITIYEMSGDSMFGSLCRIFELYELIAHAFFFIILHLIIANTNNNMNVASYCYNLHFILHMCSCISFTYYHRFHRFTNAKVFLNIFNFSTLPYIRSRDDYHKMTLLSTFKSFNKPFAAFNGVLGLLQKQDSDNIKLIMQHRVQAIMHTDNTGAYLIREFENLSDLLLVQHRSGALAVQFKTLLQKECGIVNSNYFMVYNLLSLVWRLAPISGFIVPPLVSFISRFSLSARTWLVQRVTEYVLCLTLEQVIIRAQDVVLKQGCSRTFVANDDVNNGLFFVVDGAGHKVYDTRTTDVFGDSKTLCPGRFFVTSIWTQQAQFKKQVTKQAIEKHEDNVNGKGPRAFMPNSNASA